MGCGAVLGRVSEGFAEDVMAGFPRLLGRRAFHTEEAVRAKARSPSSPRCFREMSMIERSWWEVGLGGSHLKSG